MLKKFYYQYISGVRIYYDPKLKTLFWFKPFDPKLGWKKRLGISYKIICFKK